MVIWVAIFNTVWVIGVASLLLFRLCMAILCIFIGCFEAKKNYMEIEEISCQKENRLIIGMIFQK